MMVKKVAKDHYLNIIKLCILLKCIASQINKILKKIIMYDINIYKLYDNIYDFYSLRLFDNFSFLYYVLFLLKFVYNIF